MLLTKLHRPNLGPELIKPVGQRLEPEYEIRGTKDITFQGMGTNKQLKDKGDFQEFEL